MNILVDQISDLYSLKIEGYFHLFEGFSIFVSEEGWNRSYGVNKLLLGRYLQDDLIKFIPLEIISFKDIYELRGIYGNFISIQTYYKIEFCKANDILLITDDQAVLRIAANERVEALTIKQLETKLLNENIYIEILNKSQKKIRR